MGGGRRKTITMLLWLSTLVFAAEATQGSYWVECNGETMIVRVDATGLKSVELEKWGEIPGCAPSLEGEQYTLTLPLDDELACGTTRVKNRITGETLYYHRVVITSDKKRDVKLVKCRVAPDNSTLNNIVKRDVFPSEFVEPDFLEITSEVSGEAPVPILSVGVRQSGNLVEGQIDVRPGTPLTMEVYLDNVSADIYGILMSYMEVTDTHNKQEVIIINGCSVDTNLFDNFITQDGDLVSAKFRAFKFPETNYVLFKGTVDVCLDKCQGIECSNGDIGFGRRRRSVDPNKIFEVTMKTFLKVDENFNSTEKSEVSAMEEIAKDMVNGMAKSIVAVERAIKETDVALNWNSEAEYGPEIPSSNDEPTFIYFSSGCMMTCSIYLTFAALFLLLSY